MPEDSRELLVYRCAFLDSRIRVCSLDKMDTDIVQESGVDMNQVSIASGDLYHTG